MFLTEGVDTMMELSSPPCSLSQSSFASHVYYTIVEPYTFLHVTMVMQWMHIIHFYRRQKSVHACARLDPEICILHSVPQARLLSWDGALIIQYFSYQKFWVGKYEGCFRYLNHLHVLNVFWPFKLGIFDKLIKNS